MIHQDKSTPELIELLLGTYLAQRNLYYYYIYKTILDIRKKQHLQKQKVLTIPLDKQKQTQDLLASHTQIYRQGLQFVLNEDLSQITPKEICETINTLSQSSSKQFWKYLEDNVQPKKNIIQLKQYYYISYPKIFYDEILTSEDKQYLQQFMKQSNLSKELHLVVDDLMSSYFKNRNVFKADVYRYIQRRQNNQTNSLKDSTKNQFSMIYRNSLQLIKKNQDLKSCDSKEIYQLIKDLDVQDASLFWNDVQLAKPEYSQRQLKKYFVHTYPSCIYPDRLTEDDKMYITDYCVQNRDNQSSLTEKTQYLMKTYFKDREIFYTLVYSFVNKQCIRTKTKGASHENDQLTNHFQEKLDQKIQTYTEIYHNSINAVFNKDIKQFTSVQTAKYINQLKDKESLQFWRHVSSIVKTKSSVNIQKNWYLTKYLRVLYSDHLNQEDMQHITNLCNDYKITATELAQSLIQNYFKERDIFYYEVYYYAQKKLCIFQNSLPNKDSLKTTFKEKQLNARLEECSEMLRK
ncbi:Hypothetical_protein [Hexamita inflata]|uniref:Hypothetical_protein n=1 Tax=Hexamita inflata TaxID=28002 RepID=A0AA86PSZ2_9EUKA|nr:Hypothetical protein HINF_LOCUS28057 [Hexamita inflata]